MLLKTEIKPDIHYHVFCLQLNPQDQHCDWHIWLDWILCELMRKFSFLRFTKYCVIVILLKKKCQVCNLKHDVKKQLRMKSYTFDYWCYISSFDFYSVCIILLKKSRHESKLMPNVKYSLETILFIIFTLLWHTRR